MPLVSVAFGKDHLEVRAQQGDLHIGSYKIKYMKICPECFFLDGHIINQKTGKEYHQRCICPSKEPKQGPWPGFDINEIVRLCDCCGTELLLSGSKFSVWFCDECKEEILNRNEQESFFMVPIGRHSFMNGLMMPIKGVKDETKRNEFSSDMFEFFGRTFIMQQWKQMIMKENIEMIGLTDPTLYQYLSHVKEFRKKERALYGSLFLTFKATLKRRALIKEHGNNRETNAQSG